MTVTTHKLKKANYDVFVLCLSVDVCHKVVRTRGQPEELMRTNKEGLSDMYVLFRTCEKY